MFFKNQIQRFQQSQSLGEGKTDFSIFIGSKEIDVDFLK